MRLPVGKLSRLVVLLAMAITPVLPVSQLQGASPSQTTLAKAPFEVRLRKLHLVRPDLIPYPVYFEVYC